MSGGSELYSQSSTRPLTCPTAHSATFPPRQMRAGGRFIDTNALVSHQVSHQRIPLQSVGVIGRSTTKVAGIEPPCWCWRWSTHKSTQEPHDGRVRCCFHLLLADVGGTGRRGLHRANWTDRGRAPPSAMTPKVGVIVTWRRSRLPGTITRKRPKKRKGSLEVSPCRPLSVQGLG